MVVADRAQALTVLNKQIGRLCHSSARTARIAVDAAATVGGECFGVIWPRVAITQVDALATRGNSKQAWASQMRRPRFRAVGGGRCRSV